MRGANRTRRWFLAASAAAAASHGAEAGAVGVLYRSGPEPFEQALGGLRRSLTRNGTGIEVIDLKQGTPAWDRPGLKLIVAMGAEALERMAAARPGAVAVASMALRADMARHEAGLKLEARVVLDVPAGRLVNELRSLFPNKARFGVIRNPDRPGSLDTGLAKVKPSGSSIQMVDCGRAEDLLAAFLSMRGKVDLVIAVPDGTLYNGATVKPLLMASLENRLPLVGFSASFVRAGAVAGVYPDFEEVGVQTGDVTRSVLSGAPGGEYEPQRLVVGVNLKVARLLGLEVGRPATAALVEFK